METPQKKVLDKILVDRHEVVSRSVKILPKFNINEPEQLTAGLLLALPPVSIKTSLRFTYTSILTNHQEFRETAIYAVNEDIITPPDIFNTSSGINQLSVAKYWQLVLPNYRY